MIRLLACALGMAGILTLAGTARADEPKEDAKKGDMTERVDGVVVLDAERNKIKRLNGDSVLRDKFADIWLAPDGKNVIRIQKDGDHIVVVDGNGKLKAKVPGKSFGLVVNEDGTAVDGAIVVHGAIKKKPIMLRVTDDGKIVRVEAEGLAAKPDEDDDEDELEEEIEEVVEELIKELKGEIKHARPKAKTIVRKIRRIVDGIEDLPVEEIIETIGDEMKDVRITIEMPDGKKHTFGTQGKGGKGGKGGKYNTFHLGGKTLRGFRYEPAKGLVPQALPLHGKAHGNLMERIHRLENQNHRMQQELELMRRRMNEMMGKAPKLPKVSLDMGRLLLPHPPTPPRAPRARDSQGPGAIDARLGRIEKMLHILLQGHGAKAQARAVRVHKDRDGDAPKRPKAKKRGKTDRKPDVENATRDIRKMIEHSRARIEELQRKLEAQKERLRDK